MAWQTGKWEKIVGTCAIYDAWGSRGKGRRAGQRRGEELITPHLAKRSGRRCSHGAAWPGLARGKVDRGGQDETDVPTGEHPRPPSVMPSLPPSPFHPSPSILPLPPPPAPPPPLCRPHPAHRPPSGMFIFSGSFFSRDVSGGLRPLGKL